MKIISPLLGQITQGTIFTCAQANSYPDREVQGFVITARCDIDQDKFPILNYLPVVTLNDWIEVDGYNILFSRAIAETSAQLLSILDGNLIPRSLLNSQSFKEIADAFFVEPFGNKDLRSSAKRFHELVEKHAHLSAIEAKRDVKGLYELAGKLASSMLRELVLHKLSGHYFLPRAASGGADSGFVILLREVQNLPREIAIAIARGLDKDEAAAFGSIPSLSFSIENFAMPVGQLTSPAVEHVLQTFASLFGRIGLEDHEKEYIETICARRPA